MVAYSNDVGRLGASDLMGFCEGWPRSPSPEDLLRVVRSSYMAIIARAEDDRVVGFITAISDGLMNAHIPLLEVLPAFRGQGIGTELVPRMLSELENMYAIDLACDENLVEFYRRFGFQSNPGMGLRRPLANEPGAR